MENTKRRKMKPLKTTTNSRKDKKPKRVITNFYFYEPRIK